MSDLRVFISCAEGGLFAIMYPIRNPEKNLIIYKYVFRYIYVMFRICIASLRFSRVKSKVLSSVPRENYSRKDRSLLFLPTHIRSSSIPSKPSLRVKAPGSGRSERAPSSVGDPGNGGL